MGRIYYNGQVVWSRSRFQADRKDRAFVVVEYDDYRDKLLVVPITASFVRPLPFFHIQVHHHSRLDRTTGLFKPSVAKCDEAETIATNTVVKRLGHLSDALMDLIDQAYDDYLDMYVP